MMKKSEIPNKEKMRVALYCRVATDTNEGLHLKAQQEKLRRFAEKQGYEVVAEIQEVGSGLPFDRPGVKEIFRLAHRHIMDAVLTDNMSRIGRDISTILRFEGKLKKQHIALKTLRQEETALLHMRHCFKALRQYI